MIALIKALEVLNKKIIIVTEQNAKLFREIIVDNVAQGHLISKDGVRVVECAHDEKMNALLDKLYQGKISPRLDTMIGLEVETSLQPETKSDIKSGLVDTLFEEGLLEGFFKKNNTFAKHSNVGFTWGKINEFFSVIRVFRMFDYYIS